MDLPKSVIGKLQVKVTAHQIPANVHQRLFRDANLLLIIILQNLIGGQKRIDDT